MCRPSSIRRLLLPALFLLGASEASAGEAWLRRQMTVSPDKDRGFSTIVDVATSTQGDIYVLDSDFGAIWHFSSAGELLDNVAACDTAAAQRSRCIAVGPRGHVYLACDSVVTRFERDGRVAGRIKHRDRSAIMSMVVDTLDNLYVVAPNLVTQQVIHAYDSHGRHVRSFCDSYAVGKDVDTREERAFAGGRIDITRDGEIYFAQRTPALIRVFDRKGILLRTVRTRRETSAAGPKANPVGERGIELQRPAISTSILAMRDGGFITSVLTHVPGALAEDKSVSFVDRYDERGNRLSSETHEGWFVPMAVLTIGDKERVLAAEIVNERYVLGCYFIESSDIKAPSGEPSEHRTKR